MDNIISDPTNAYSMTEQSRTLLKKFMEKVWPEYRNNVYRGLYRTYHPSTYNEGFSNPMDNIIEAIDEIDVAQTKGTSYGLIHHNLEYLYPGGPHLEIHEGGNTDTMSWLPATLLFNVLWDIVEEFRCYCGENGVDPDCKGKCMGDFPYLYEDYNNLHDYMKKLESQGAPLDILLDEYPLQLNKIHLSPDYPYRPHEHNHNRAFAVSRNRSRARGLGEDIDKFLSRRLSVIKENIYTLSDGDLLGEGEQHRLEHQMCELFNLHKHEASEHLFNWSIKDVIKEHNLMMNPSDNKKNELRDHLFEQLDENFGVFPHPDGELDFEGQPVAIYSFEFDEFVPFDSLYDPLSNLLDRGIDQESIELFIEIITEWISYRMTEKPEMVNEGIPTPGKTSAEGFDDKDLKPTQIKHMNLGEILSQIKGIAYYKEVLEDLEKGPKEWEQIKKHKYSGFDGTNTVVEYADYWMKHPESLTGPDFPPIQVIGDGLKDGSHRISTLYALANFLDKDNDYWKNVDLEVKFYKPKDLMAKGHFYPWLWDISDDELQQAIDDKVYNWEVLERWLSNPNSKSDLQKLRGEPITEHEEPGLSPELEIGDVIKVVDIDREVENNAIKYHIPPPELRPEKFTPYAVVDKESNGSESKYPFRYTLIPEDKLEEYERYEVLQNNPLYQKKSGVKLLFPWVHQWIYADTPMANKVDRLTISENIQSAYDNEDLCDELTISTEEELREKLEGMSIGKEDRNEIEGLIDQMLIDTESLHPHLPSEEAETDFDISNVYGRKIQSILCTYEEKNINNLDEIDIDFKGTTLGKKNDKFTDGRPPKERSNYTQGVNEELTNKTKLNPELDEGDHVKIINIDGEHANMPKRWEVYVVNSVRQDNATQEMYYGLYPKVQMDANLIGSILAGGGKPREVYLYHGDEWIRVENSKVNPLIKKLNGMEVEIDTVRYDLGWVDEDTGEATGNQFFEISNPRFEPKMEQPEYVRNDMFRYDLIFREEESGILENFFD